MTWALLSMSTSWYLMDELPQLRTNIFIVVLFNYLISIVLEAIVAKTSTFKDTNFF